MAAELVLCLGVQERDLRAAHVVHDYPGEFAVRADLEPLLVWNVGDLQVHGSSRMSGLAGG